MLIFWFFVILIIALTIIIAVIGKFRQISSDNEKLKKEVHKATIELINANQKLVRLDQAKSEFISIASHQLRTPLTVIKGYVSMMLEGNFGELTDAGRVSLEKVYESNERLVLLVEGLLNVSRIESGRLQYDFETGDLGELTQRVFDQLKAAAARKDLTFTLKKPVKLPALKFDKEKMYQVIANLIDNAIRYTKKGSITVSLSKNDDGVEFCVSDSGMGISADDLKGLFRKFTRNTGSSLVHTEGTGLGLYVAKEMIKAHGGRIWTESPGEGRGSKFYFFIPFNNNLK